MSQDIADEVRGKCRVAAVSDAYKLAPWADLLASHDRAWWRSNPEAFTFPGLKYSRHKLQGVEEFSERIPAGCNSGLFAMHICKSLGASRILLFGFDMHGTHYFGKHPEPLKNTSPKRFAQHIRQFDQWRGCEVINCTPGSALKRFPFGDFRAILGA